MQESYANGPTIRHSRGQYVPYAGMLFTAYARENPGRDPRIDRVFPDYTCYVKLKSLFFQGDLTLGEPFRFLVVAGPLERRFHQYAEVAPFRPLVVGEPSSLCIVTGLDFNHLKDIASRRKPEISVENLTIREDLQHLRSLHERGIRF